MKKILFIHINKCGGTSLKKSLRSCKNVFFLEGLRADSLNHLVYTEFKDFIKFTVVRNPYDRILSCKGMLARSGQEVSINYILDLLEDDKIPYDAKSAFKGARSSYIKRHSLPMSHKHYGIYNESTNKLNIDYFFKLENISRDFSKIEQIVGKKLQQYHLNKSGKNKKALTATEIQRINYIYELDFKNFGYNKL